MGLSKRKSLYMDFLSCERSRFWVCHKVYPRATHLVFVLVRLNILCNFRMKFEGRHSYLPAKLSNTI